MTVDLAGSDPLCQPWGGPVGEQLERLQPSHRCGMEHRWQRQPRQSLLDGDGHALDAALFPWNVRRRPPGVTEPGHERISLFLGHRGALPGVGELVFIDEPERRADRDAPWGGARREQAHVTATLVGPLGEDDLEVWEFEAGPPEPLDGEIQALELFGRAAANGQHGLQRDGQRIHRHRDHRLGTGWRGHRDRDRMAPGRHLCQDHGEEGAEGGGGRHGPHRSERPSTPGEIRLTAD
jgi:hypothetical protein